MTYRLEEETINKKIVKENTACGDEHDKGKVYGLENNMIERESNLF